VRLVQLAAANIIAAYTPQILNGETIVKSFDKQYRIYS
jgi:hypothetical protein